MVVAVAQWRCGAVALWRSDAVALWRSGAVARASDSRLREFGFEACAAVSNIGQVLFTLHCSSSFSCMNEYLAVDSGVYLSRIVFRTLTAA